MIPEKDWKHLEIADKSIFAATLIGNELVTTVYCEIAEPTFTTTVAFVDPENKKENELPETILWRSVTDGYGFRKMSMSDDKILGHAQHKNMCVKIAEVGKPENKWREVESHETEIDFVYGTVVGDCVVFTSNISTKKEPAKYLCQVWKILSGIDDLEISGIFSPETYSVTPDENETLVEQLHHATCVKVQEHNAKIKRKYGESDGVTPRMYDANMPPYTTEEIMNSLDPQIKRFIQELREKTYFVNEPPVFETIDTENNISGEKEVELIPKIKNGLRLFKYINDPASYVVYNKKLSNVASVDFQSGPIHPEDGGNGIQVETLLMIAMDRLIDWQQGPMRNESNTAAILSIESALRVLDMRTEDRRKREVEGTDDR